MAHSGISPNRQTNLRDAAFWKATLGDEPRKLSAIRLDSKVLDWLGSAETKGVVLPVFDQRDLGGGDEETGLG